MITIAPIPLALVPVNSEAATRISTCNYDEFQGDDEIWNFIRANPMSVLGVTMPQCDVPSLNDIGKEDSATSLTRAKLNMEELIKSDLTKEIQNILWIYEIEDPRHSEGAQIGLGGMARTDQIRTKATPQGAIIRNEGIRERKARGRADLIEATDTIIGTVNNAIDDVSGVIQATLKAHTYTTSPDFEVTDCRGAQHRVWILDDPMAIAFFIQLFSKEPHAYVADGNHRSAAAVMLGYESFLAVFFPAKTMNIYPYNRLVSGVEDLSSELLSAVAKKFEITELFSTKTYQPAETHQIGLYSLEEGWIRLCPLTETFDPGNAVDAIDANIVQRNLFSEIFGIEDPGDSRLTFVGSNKDAAWLQAAVDERKATYAVTLPAVTMEQFIEVCRQNRQMPPKSTWFEPKIRSGLVMAIL